MKRGQGQNKFANIIHESVARLITMAMRIRDTRILVMEFT